MSTARTPDQPGKPHRHGTLFSQADGLFAALAHARDRQRAALGRQRRIVGIAKIVLPAIAAVLLFAIVIFPDLRSGASFGRVTYRELPQASGAALSRMSTAEYRGVDARGEKFTITARHAVQTGGDRLSLTGPKGDITTKGGAWFMLDARNGVYHQKTQRLDLAGKVTLYRADGTTMRTRQATIDIQAGTADGHDPVSAFGPFGTLTSAQGFTARNRGQIITFTGPSHLVLDQADPSSTATGAGGGS